MLPPFSPGTSITLSATTTSGTSSATALPLSANRQVLVQNAGAVPAFVEFGTSAVAAAVATSLPILAGGSRVFSIPASVTHAAAITGSSTATVYVTPGHGQ